MSEVSIRVIQFSGKSIDWPVWSEKFLARARRKKYRDILTGKIKVPDDKSDPDYSSILKLNEEAYEDIILSIKGETEEGRVVFQLIKGAKTANLPDGDSYKAWSALKNKFEATTVPSRLLLKSKINNLRFKTKQDPATFICALEDLVMQYNNAGGSWTEVDSLEHICNILPKQYEVVIHPLEKRIGSSTDPLSLNELQDELNLKFVKMNGGKYGDDDDDEGEVGLKGLNSPGKSQKKEVGLYAGGFKGRCFNCGKQGHKSSECKEKKNNYCRYCRQNGHVLEDCPKLKEKKKKEKKEAANLANSDDEEMAFAQFDDEFLLNAQVKSGTFIADSGASCHMTGSLDGMTNIRDCNDGITIGNGNTISCTKVGDKRGKIILPNGNEKTIELRDCKFIPDLAPYNLFSITKAIDAGYKLDNDGRNIILKKENFEMVFNKVIGTKKGFVVAIELECEKESSIATKATEYGNLDINKFHKILGHMGESKVKNIAKKHNIKLMGEMKPCTDCAKAKIKKAKLPKFVDADKKAKLPGERLYFDISSVKTESLSGRKYWLLIVDEATDHCWSFFLKKKSESSKVLKDLIMNLKSRYNTAVTYLRCDNSGENKATESLFRRNGIPIKFEFTAPNTPQQNGVVERKLATLYGRIRSMLNAARINEELREKLWA